jgi:hypothetical protein
LEGKRGAVLINGIMEGWPSGGVTTEERRVFNGGRRRRFNIRANDSSAIRGPLAGPGPELSCRAPAWRGVGWGPFRSRGCKYCTYYDDMAIASWPTSRKLFTTPSILNLDIGIRCTQNSKILQDFS